jgi:tetratricopeptide (TPR) repeat protein
MDSKRAAKHGPDVRPMTASTPIRWAWVAVGVTLAAMCYPVHLQAQSLGPDNPTYRTIEKVFDDLVGAIGDGRAAPSLSVLPRAVDEGMKVAWFVPSNSVLYVEERAFDLCRKVGADSLNALAALLGHELAHFYKEHDWQGDFGNGFADIEVGRSIRQLERAEEQMVRYESEADYFGGLYGYVAGYNTLAVTPEFLRLVYDEYELDEAIRGYPSLGDRQEIAKRQQAKLEMLIPVFEAGNHLLLLNEFTAAADCFDHISRTFPSREILNNAGVARALAAQDLFQPGELRFAYPFELDADSRLRQDAEDHRSGFAGTDSERRTRLLRSARDRFAEAHQRDGEYAAAIVNLACVADLLGNPEEAVYLAKEAMKVAGKGGDALSRANALIIRGIAQASDALGEVDLGRTDFEEAKLGNSPLALANLAILDRADPFDPSRQGREKLSVAREQSIGQGTPEYETIAADGVVTTVPVGAQGRSDIFVYTKELEGFDGFIIDAGSEQGIISLLSTWPGYSGETTRGIEVGSRFDEVQARYGQPTRLITGRRQTHTIYEKAGISFRIDADGMVSGWTLFRTEKGEFYDPVAEVSQEVSKELRVALVVGNSEYADSPLRNTVNDAVAMTKALQECGFDVEQRIDAKRRDLDEAIRNFGVKLKAGGVGLFCYAGHGAQVESQDYLIPVDADIQYEPDVKYKGIRVTEVLDYMASAHNRINIVILDACRNNPYARRFRSGSLGLGGSSGTTAEGAASGALIAYSTGPGMVAEDGGGENGLYTEKLLQFMFEPGLTIEQVFKSVAREVRNATGDDQRPWQTNNLTEDFYFLPSVEAQGFAL